MIDLVPGVACVVLKILQIGADIEVTPWMKVAFLWFCAADTFTLRFCNIREFKTKKLEKGASLEDAAGASASTIRA
jgi:hypothetical protein